MKHPGGPRHRNSLMWQPSHQAHRKSPSRRAAERQQDLAATYYVLQGRQRAAARPGSANSMGSRAVSRQRRDGGTTIWRILKELLRGDGLR